MSGGQLAEGGVQSGGGTGQLQENDVARSTWSGERAAVGTEDTAEALEQLLPDLQDLSVAEATLEELVATADRLRRLGGLDPNGVNAGRIESEYQKALRLLEQIEIAVSSSSNASQTNRSALSGGSSDYRKEVADYYRDLSESSGQRVAPTAE